MDPASLATTAAVTLVSTLTTETWERARTAVARWWGQRHPQEPDSVGSQLELVRRAVLRARLENDDEAQVTLAVRWQCELEQLQRERPALVDEFRQLVDHELRPVLNAGEQRYVSELTELLLKPPVVSHWASRHYLGPTAVTITNTLPRRNPFFTGRDEELRRLTESVGRAMALGAAAVHTIDGMAGVGKTGLAVHLAHDLADRFPDGRLFVSLHGHTPGRLPARPFAVLGDQLSRLGVPTPHLPPDQDGRSELWRDLLRSKRMLIILDDATGHGQVRPLLPGDGRCLVLITSRRRLTALPETESLSLDTLPHAEACQLFIRLMSRALRSEEEGAIGELARLCGCLPLAIALLAGKLRHHPAWDTTDLVDNLTSAQHRLAEFQAEDVRIGAAFDLSYRNLPPGRQRLFLRLGLHIGSDMDAHAAAALGDIPLSEAREHLEALYTDHLLDEPVRGRYRMHDLLKDHARNHAAQDPPEETRQAIERLLDYYETTAEAAHRHLSPQSWQPDPTVTPARTPLPSLPDRRAALQWMRSEHANLLACAARASAQAQHARVVRLAFAMHAFLHQAGPWEQALALHRAAVAAAQLMGARQEEARALRNLGTMLYLTDNYTQATDTLERALILFQRLEDPHGQADVLTDLGVVHGLTDGYGHALELLGQACTTYHRLGDLLGEARALSQLAGVQRLTDDYPRALGTFQQALAVHRAFGNRFGEAGVLAQIGGVLRLRGMHEQATTVLEPARDLCHEVDDRLGEAVALKELGVVHRLTDNLTRSVDLLTQALAIYRSLGDRFGEAGTLAHLGAGQGLMGKLEEATSRLRQALTIHVELGSRHGEAVTRNEWGVVLRNFGDLSGARYQHARALRLARTVPSPLEEARALEGIGRCDLRRGRQDPTGTHLRQALAIYQRIGAGEALTFANGPS
jgi:tetratricopeptide (TPR) repeat protein